MAALYGYKMPKTLIKVKCQNCDKKFNKYLGNYNQSMKYGWGTFCSKRCSGIYGNKNRQKKSPEKRFWKFVRKTKNCWIWIGGKANGYGYFWLNGKQCKATRVSWEFHFESIPPEVEVMHKCDNPSCVNPDHLCLGTHQENMTDMKNKGRAGFVRRVGSSSPSSKLTDEQVEEIRQRVVSGETHESVAKDYPVGKTTVTAIINGRIRKES